MSHQLKMNAFRGHRARHSWLKVYIAVNIQSPTTLLSDVFITISQKFLDMTRLGTYRANYISRAFATGTAHITSPHTRTNCFLKRARAAKCHVAKC